MSYDMARFATPTDLSRAAQSKNLIDIRLITGLTGAMSHLLSVPKTVYVSSNPGCVIKNDGLMMCVTH